MNNHIPVMLMESIDGLKIKPNGIYIDGTLGLGGHSAKIASKLEDGKLICVDLDEDAISLSQERLKDYSDKLLFIHDNFKNVISHLDKLKISKIDGLLLDLGVSSMQIDTAARGFSYMNDGPIDMRMNQKSHLSGSDVINNYSEVELIRILREYGEEKFAARIARKICEIRNVKRIETTRELAEIVANCYPANYREGHPSKKTFQGVRIHVNEELSGLYQFILDIAKRMNSKGRIAIISFHSLEDRIVKYAFNYLAATCVCDKSIPVCTCGKQKLINIVNKKPIIPSKEEVEINKRSSSAKLRIAEII